MIMKGFIASREDVREGPQSRVLPIHTGEASTKVHKANFTNPQRRGVHKDPQRNNQLEWKITQQPWPKPLTTEEG
jgi:hypothetical protein